MRVSNSCSSSTQQDSASDAFQKRLSDSKGSSGKAGQPGKSGADGASGKPGSNGSATASTNTGRPSPSEPDGGGGNVVLGAPLPAEPGSGAGGAVPISGPGDDVTTLAIGEEDGGAGGAPMPVEPDGGIGDGAGPIPGFDENGDPLATTLAIGEEDGGGGGAPMPVEPGGGIGDGAPPIPGHPGGETIRGTRGNDFLQGTNGDDTIRGRKGDDFITTGQGNDVVRGGKGDDIIDVTGTGDKKIDGGKGHDTLQLKGQEADYAIDNRRNGTTVYTAEDGSRIVARNIESVTFTGVTMEPTGGSDFAAFYDLAPNALGATSLEVAGDTAVLKGPNGTDFTFTGVDASGLAADGPIIATGGSGTIGGEETTAVPLSPFGPAVLNIGSGFNPTGTQGVSATFANGATLDTTVQR